MRKIVVAIDGYSSCGKSTIAKALAQYAGYTYVDTGAMYRAIGLYTLRHHLTAEADIIAALPQISVGFVLIDGAQHVTLNGEDVESQIRTLEVGNRASEISQIREVRAFLVAQQQQMGEAKGIVMDGRDMVGAPDATFPLEMYSTQYAGNYQQQIWRSAEQLGYGALFTNMQSYPITDDHFYVNRIAGIPCVDIIHYDIRNATGFASWWHTRQDNMDNIAKSTLQAVGEVVMSQL